MRIISYRDLKKDGRIFNISRKKKNIKQGVKYIKTNDYMLAARYEFHMKTYVSTAIGWNLYLSIIEDEYWEENMQKCSSKLRDKNNVYTNRTASMIKATEYA